MRSLSVPTKGVIIFLSIITILLQFGIYYFTDSLPAALLLTAGITLFFCHILLEVSFSYNSCFLYTLFCILGGTIFIVYFYIQENNPWIHFNSSLCFILLLEGMISVCYSILRNLHDRGPRFIDFSSIFFRYNLLFFVYYIVTAGYFFFYQPVFYPVVNSPIRYKLIPFMSIAAYIEDYIYDHISITPVLFYCAISTILFIPFGFFVKLCLTNSPVWKRIGLIFVLPIIIEVVQYFLFVKTHSYEVCSIDDFLFSLLGSFIGTLCYCAIDALYLYRTEQHFLENNKRIISYQDSYYL